MLTTCIDVAGTDREGDAEQRVALAVAGAIRAVRRRQGLSLQDLADRLGIPASDLSRWERGTRPVTFGRLTLIADALEVDPLMILREAGIVRDVSSVEDLIETDPALDPLGRRVVLRTYRELTNPDEDDADPGARR